MPPTKPVIGGAAALRKCRLLIASQKKQIRKLKAEKRKLKTVIKEIKTCSMQYFQRADHLQSLMTDPPSCQ